MTVELTAERMAELLPMERAVDLMKDAFRLLSSGEAVCPVRLNLAIEDRNASSLVMPCHVPGSGYFGIKTANVFPENRAAGLPVIHSVYHFYSAESGELLASIDGSWLTRLRTGAASGLATDLLAAKNATVLAVFGTGVQAESQVEAVCCVREISEVLVFGRSQAGAEDFSERLSARCDASIRPATGASDLRRADVICTATTATAALFDADDVKPGAHVNAIGAYRPDMCEIPADLIASCDLFVDQVEAALEEAGDIIQPLQAGRIGEDAITGEIGALVAGTISPEREADRVSVFKSVGSAVQDFVCARDLFERLPQSDSK